MPPTTTAHPTPDILPVTIVIAATTVMAIAIAAWLVHQVVCRAIDKATPEGVAPVILALSALLSALLHPLRAFLPWSSQSESSQPPFHTCGSERTSLHNEIDPDPPQEARHEAQR